MHWITLGGRGRGRPPLTRQFMRGLRPSNSPWIGFLPTTGFVVQCSSQGRFSFVFYVHFLNKCHILWKMWFSEQILKKIITFGQISSPKAPQNTKPMPQRSQEPYQEQKAQLIKCDSDIYLDPKPGFSEIYSWPELCILNPRTYSMPSIMNGWPAG